MKKVILILLIGFLSSCSSDGDDSKNLFSLWTETQDGFILDLTGFEFNTPATFEVFFEGGGICNCDLTFIGSQSSGAFNLSSCFYVDFSGSIIPNCNALNSSGNYTKDAFVLSLTSENGTSTFEKTNNVKMLNAIDQLYY